MSIRLIIGGIAIIFWFSLLAFPAYGEADNGGRWKFQLAPYAWLSGQKGRIATQPGHPPTDIDLDFHDDISDSINGALFLVGEARKDRYGIVADIAYTDIEFNDPTPGPFYSNLNSRTKTWIFSAAGFHRMIQKNRGFLDLMAGFRYWSVDASLNFSAGILPAAESSNKEDWIDPLIGFKGMMPLGTSRFFLSGSLGAGGFKVGSDFMWDMMANIGYQWTQRFSTTIGYRYMEVDYDEGGFLYDVSQDGLVIGDPGDFKKQSEHRQFITMKGSYYHPFFVLRTCLIFTGFFIIILHAGCASTGPKTIPRDRFDYNKAVSDSWKEQTLLNIVKLRYSDMPLFMEVASIVSGHTLESQVNLGGNIVLSGTDSDLLSMGASGKYIDRPTITYTPITGQKFHKSFMTPIPPSAILFLMQSGWPIDVIFPLTVDTINGLRCHISAGKNARPGDPDYYKVVALLRKIQKSGALGMRILRKKNQKESTVMFFHHKNIPLEIEHAFDELNRLLGLEMGDREMTISYGFIPREDDEIAMLTRSILQIMIEMAKQIDVPFVHVTQGRTGVGIPYHRDLNQNQVKLITVSQDTVKPEDAFTAVKYKDHWFSIDDKDFKSKRSFAILMILFSLTESSGKEGLPLVTIPAG